MAGNHPIVSEDHEPFATRITQPCKGRPENEIINFKQIPRENNRIVELELDFLRMLEFHVESKLKSYLHTTMKSNG